MMAPVCQDLAETMSWAALTLSQMAETKVNSMDVYWAAKKARWMVNWRAEKTRWVCWKVQSWQQQLGLQTG